MIYVSLTMHNSSYLIPEKIKHLVFTDIFEIFIFSESQLHLEQFTIIATTQTILKDLLNTILDTLRFKFKNVYVIQKETKTFEAIITSPYLFLS